MARTGVLITATGGPSSLDEVRPFLEVLNGVAPDDQAVAGLTRAIMTIGGRSPELFWAERVAAQMERALNGLEAAEPVEDAAESLIPVVSASSARSAEPVEIPVQVGFLAADPSIDEAVARLTAAGAQRLVVLTLMPCGDPARAGAIAAVAHDAVSRAGLTAVDGAGWEDTDLFIRALADGCQAAVEEVFPEHQPLVVFVAPAPSQDHAGSDAVVSACESTVIRLVTEIGLGAPDRDAIENLLGLPCFGGTGVAAPWLLAYQRESGTTGPVTGPSVAEAVDAARTRGLGGVAVLPFAWTVDDTTVLYELDVEIADAVLTADMEYARAGLLNDDPRFIEVLATAVRGVL